METTKVKRTPLYTSHTALNARMMPFGGYDMPVQYNSIVAEHHAVREAAGLFDVSHMGEFFVEGPEAFDFLQYLVSNDLSKLYDGKALYTVMCNESGGIVDDLLVYRFNEHKYMLVVNASNIEKDWNWIQSVCNHDVTLSDHSDNMALLAIQGPSSHSILQKLTKTPLSEIKYYHFVAASSFMNLDGVILSHTGYTGEPGFEIYCNASDAQVIWDALLEHGKEEGLLPAGLGARDTLRLEAGYCLYGNDLTDETSPYAAGLGWITKPDKGDFVGRDALLKIKADSPENKLVGFIIEEKGIARSGYPILNDAGDEIGIVTSGSQSPILKKGIGMGYVKNNLAYTTPGHKILVSVRSKRIEARIAKPPFHKQ